MTDETGTNTAVYDKWLKELEQEAKIREPWRTRAEKVIDRYKDEKQRVNSKFNILWSNTKVLSAATLSSRPKPSVSRRYKDDNPVARQVSEVLERALAYSIDVYDFDGNAFLANLDYLLPGLGQMRVRYIPYFEKGEAPVIPLIEENNDIDEQIDPIYKTENGEEVNDPQFSPDGMPYMIGEPQDELIYEELTCEVIPWNRFRWQVSNTWENCHWCAIEHYLSKEEVRSQFPEHVELIPYGYTSEGKKATCEEDGKDRARIYEIFDKIERKIIVLADGYKTVLNEENDPLGLQNFYPFPKPMLANVTAEDTTPSPDFLFYQDQAAELDDLTQRISKITKQIKYRGFYDGTFKGLANITTLDDGEFDPVEDWSQRFPSGRRLDDAIASMPINDLMSVLQMLQQAREVVKQTIYEITGLSDIIRGATKATETLGAQQLKQQNAGLRLTEKQNEVARFFRDIFRIKAEIMAEQFSPETLSMMTGVPVDPEMSKMMQSDMLRTYSIDVESDSTVAVDQSMEQENVTKLLAAVSQFMAAAMPLTQQGVPPAIIVEMLLFAIRRFKGSRQLEQILEKIGAQDAGNGAVAVNPQMGGETPALPIQ